MKTLAVCLLIVTLFLINSGSIIHFDVWQFPLWISDISWTGIELIGALIAIIVVIVIAIAALVTMGLVGAAMVALAGTILAFLFGSLMIAWPLLFVAGLCWLIADNKKVAS
ncbi:hypothetical protein AMS57_13280 [Pseudoalteromonas undina]|uniref:hypothetical protein n=1 Tax=Pseudoalteromonas undina TaxID=43660 RepID=UPI0006BAAA5D|nr:hypothetical protein [Pseudoalteromonas undina]KPH90439.1 hypothetical protein AMS57_13280 [Pseudoalteromonas undina]